MDRNSTIKSQALKNLIHTSNEELITRYISKRVAPISIQKEVESVLSAEGEDGNAKYGAMATFANKLPNGNYGSASTNYIYENLFVNPSRILSKQGYKLNVENIIKDLDDIFNDYALLVLDAHDNPQVVPNFVKEVVSVFYMSVLREKVINQVLGNKFSNLL